jgi:hypothetical protein
LIWQNKMLIFTKHCQTHLVKRSKIANAPKQLKFCEFKIVFSIGIGTDSFIAN